MQYDYQSSTIGSNKAKKVHLYIYSFIDRQWQNINNTIPAVGPMSVFILVPGVGFEKKMNCKLASTQHHLEVLWQSFYYIIYITIDIELEKNLEIHLVYENVLFMSSRRPAMRVV